MQREYFQRLENLPDQTSIQLSEIIEQLAFNEQGLIPVIAQDASSKDILMFAWMNRESLIKTIDTKRMTYWSRSRNQLWIKGETSGHTQHVRSIAFDCDGDVVLCQIDQVGGACHTGRPSCFYLDVNFEQGRVTILGDALA
ncbi:phosphoribosyl-AMP cyclohydrolase [Alteromonas sp. C1M14]|uniref:phosphoribosyl-AMP cyclohydrolase n=1 Tax=Alteromonas sp. C1M14 TaxID=2841567 RepID=UPI001C0917E7|nr:phosphoribosyl-AMP cyclohydrolase [Alteromonas sp. C1M14]MBU2978747.1 phosphoribosyl-AMP cyclohydrolase [Alteromonas sp. C1M14]